MSRNPDPADWMWARACQFVEQAERMQRQFFRLAASPRAQATWQPPMDVLEDEREITIVVAMPGVAPTSVEIVSHPGLLIVRGVRGLPMSSRRQAVRHLEIPHGRFERRIALPPARLELVANELIDGCLVLRLRKTA